MGKGKDRRLLVVMREHMRIQALFGRNRSSCDSPLWNHPPDQKDSQGMIFTVPLEHLGGIDMAQVEKFEQHLKDSL